mmetsp:Transcript_28229/g.56576  ORF Transcript_28229/g.56576 Transcript_28229/m.56576 type:complete len:204 (-) Transcript_28229:744-1355(-)
MPPKGSESMDIFCCIFFWSNLPLGLNWPEVGADAGCFFFWDPGTFTAEPAPPVNGDGWRRCCCPCCCCCGITPLNVFLGCCPCGGLFWTGVCLMCDIGAGANFCAGGGAGKDSSGSSGTLAPFGGCADTAGESPDMSSRLGSETAGGAGTRGAAGRSSIPSRRFASALAETWTGPGEARPLLVGWWPLLKKLASVGGTDGRRV